MGSLLLESGGQLLLESGGQLLLESGASESVLVATHIAVIDKLSTDLTTPVYNSIPDNTPYPYVVLDDYLVLENDSLVEHYQDVILYLTIWSDYKGSKEVSEIIENVRSSLHMQSLTLSNGVVITSQVREHRLALDRDDETYMGEVDVVLVVAR